MKWLYSGFVIILYILSACSLNYETAENTESVNPEFIFTDITVNRYEKGKQSAKLSAEKIELYKNDNKTFARNISFETFTGTGAVETEGRCGLLAADMKTEQYTLFDSIHILNHTRNMQILAQNLYWNNKTEQLTGEKEGIITLKKDDATLTGKGFSASGISNSFSFLGPVSGTITASEQSK